MSYREIRRGLIAFAIGLIANNCHASSSEQKPIPQIERKAIDRDNGNTTAHNPQNEPYISPSPLNVSISGDLNNNSYNEQAPTDTETNKWADPTNLLTLALVFCNAGLWFVTSGLAKITNGLLTAANTQSLKLTESVDLARKEFVASHRPRLTFRSVRISNKYPFKEGEKVHGELIAVNTGNSAATLIHHETYVYISSTPLPMRAPYLDKTEGRNMIFHDGGFGVSAGAACTLGFISEKVLPDNLYIADWHSFTNKGVHTPSNLNWRIYIMGYVAYRDDNSVDRITGFCRMYDAPSGRFVKVDNPDYEYEE